MGRLVFNLKAGMKGEELLKELRGRISGESRQQIQTFFQAHTPLQEVPLPSHEVVLADDEYAVIDKRMIFRGFC